MSNPISKSSQYLQSLVDYIGDTKPYHSKLTEIVEEYQFAENLNVKITETTFVKSMHKAAWVYNFFSDGSALNRSILAQRVISPDFVRTDKNNDPLNTEGRWKAGRDENTDMASVPLVFSKKQFDGIGVADGWIEIGGSLVQPYVEGIDFFQSHGSLEFQVRQTFQDAPVNTILKQTWAETRTNGVISSITLATQALEQNLARPQSAINGLIALTNTIQAHLFANPQPGDPNFAAALVACAGLLADLATGVIPPPFTVAPGNPDLILTGYYETIIFSSQAALPAIPPAGFAGWVGEDGVPDTGPVPPRSLYVDEAYMQLLPTLLFNMHSDIALHESGELSYDDVVGPSLQVFGITANPLALSYEEWELENIIVSPSTWRVRGTVSGIIGSVVAGNPFIGANISFVTSGIGAPTLGEKVLLTPRNKFVVHPTSLLETWNIIKVNPRSYSRPVLVSSRYGFIRDLLAVVGRATLLDQTLAQGTIVLTATTATTFSLTNTADPLHVGVATVGTVYNDGKIGFTIMPGSSRPFVVGDTFFIQITNILPTVEEFDLYYGYDLDSYDNPDLVYENIVPLDPDHNRFIDFWYDSRFTDYELATMGLTLTDSVVDQRVFRLMAIPNLSRPLVTLKRDGLTISGSVDLTAEDDEIAPVTVTGVPVFSMPGDLNPADDVMLYYSDTFRLEYSDDGFVTTTVVGTVPVGGSFSDPGLGISLSLPAGSKPFIAASSDDGLAVPRVEGGDTFSFRVNNPLPQITNIPIGLTGANAPRLIMHGDSYYKSVPANWTVTFSSNVAYTVTGTYTTGPLANTTVAGYPVSATLSLTGVDARAGATYRDENVHFTILTGRGLALGDSFTFTTYERKPSFLVHGSVSGWQPDAEYDKWYWNGSIGFKVRSPIVNIFRKEVSGGPNGFVLTSVPGVSGYHPFTVGSVSTLYIRPDAPTMRYVFQRVANGWRVSRSDVDVISWLAPSATYEDQYLTAQVVDTTEDFIVEVLADNYDFWNAQDTVIVRSDISILNPSTSDFAVFKKTEEGTFEISLDYSALGTPVPSSLGPLAIDLTMVDLNTGGDPLGLTSPEVDILTGWLPTFTVKHDTLSSVAEFPDPIARYSVYSAVNGELIGELHPQGTALEEPTLFTFDSTFFTNYLPLNAQASLVTYGTYLDENVRVLISERLNILSSGGAIFTNSLFNDSFNVTITEEHVWSINQTLEDAVAAIIADGPFGGFLPGFDNLPLDEEDGGSSSYDFGVPLVGKFMEAQQLAGILPMDPSQLALTVPEQQLRLATLISLIGAFLNGGSLALTTLDQFLANIDAAYPLGVPPTVDFGLPVVGLGIDITNNSTDVGQTGIQEGFSIQLLERSDRYDENGFDSQPLDAYGQRDAIVFSQTAPPVPPMVIAPSAPPSPSIGDLWLDLGTQVLSEWDGSAWVLPTFASLNTPLEVAGYAVRTIDVSFSVNVAGTPIIQILRPPTLVQPNPVLESVGVVQRINSRLFRFTVAVPSEGKLICF